MSSDVAGELDEEMDEGMIANLAFRRDTGDTTLYR